MSALRSRKAVVADSPGAVFVDQIDGQRVLEGRGLVVADGGLVVYRPAKLYHRGNATFPNPPILRRKPDDC